MKKFILDLIAILGSFQAHADSNTIHVIIMVPTCYQNSIDAAGRCFKIGKNLKPMFNVLKQIGSTLGLLI